MAEKKTDNSFSIKGREFENYEVFCVEFREFCQTSYQPLTIATNNKRQVTIQCRHGRKRATESSGKRINLRYNYLACPAKITCYKPAKSNCIKITSVNLEHNHEVSQAAYNSFTAKLSEKEEEVVTDLREANCKVSQIRRVLKTKFDKDLSSQKLRNLIQKLAPAKDDDGSQLQTFLEEIEREGGIVNYDKDIDGDVSVLFVSSQSMKEAFLQSACTTVQVDTTFNIDASKYKLLGFCYLNPETNCSEICALAFLSEETAANLRQAFRFFKRMCLEAPTVFIVDKDFNEINILKEVFKLSTILLCNFHVIKYVKNLISTALLTVERKNYLMNTFKSMMYARSEEIYEDEKNSFLTSVGDIQVRVNKNYVLLKDQFLNNWDNCKQMWVAFYRSGLPTLGDNTNNRVERSFWTLKQSIEDRFTTLPVIEKSVIHLVSFCEERISGSSSQANLKSLRIFDSDPHISNLNQEAALSLNERGCMIFYKSLKALQVRRENMRIVDGAVHEHYKDEEIIYNCSLTNCVCTFYCNNQSPCRHILLKREIELQQSVFSLSLFHARYHRKSIDNNHTPSFQAVAAETSPQRVTEYVDSEEDLIFTEASTKPLSSREKYNLIFPVMMNIASLAQYHGTEQFMSYLTAMKEVEKLVRAGSDIKFATSQDISSEKEQGDESDEKESETFFSNDIASLTPNKKFEKMQFRTNVKSRGRPKRAVRQLCSFNKTNVDREVTKTVKRKRLHE